MQQIFYELKQQLGVFSYKKQKNKLKDIFSTDYCETNWIPCSVSQPKSIKAAIIYVATKRKEEERTFGLGEYKTNYRIGGWYGGEWHPVYEGEKVLAWHLLPEPYKGKIENE